jgi:hypothetical protein
LTVVYSPVRSKTETVYTHTLEHTIQTAYTAKTRLPVVCRMATLGATVVTALVGDALVVASVGSAVVTAVAGASVTLAAVGCAGVGAMCNKHTQYTTQSRSQ